MAGKVLMNVYTIQVKNDLLSIFISNAYDVLEAQNEHDLLFKYNLVKDNLAVYVQEFDEMNHDHAIEQIQKIDRDKTRCIIIIHEYSRQIIDEALALNIKDIIVLPMDRSHLEKKIIPPVYSVRPSTAMPKEPPKVNKPALVPEEAIIFDDQPMTLEIARASRGNYPMSLVLTHYNSVGDEAFALFEDELRRQLRTTDQVLRFDNHSLLLICPFTPKGNLVDVENKVRDAFGTVTFKGYTQGNIYLYGVTYPVDGETASELIDKLKDGIHDSKVFSEINGPMDRMKQREVRDRLRRNY